MTESGRSRLWPIGPRGRRRFFWTVALAPLAWGLSRLLPRLREAQQSIPVHIPGDIPEGLTIVGDAVVLRSADGGVVAYAARCTHLGCRIERVQGDAVVCPCHGSRFGSDGRVLSGPAVRPLQRLRIEPEAERGGWLAHGS